MYLSHRQNISYILKYIMSIEILKYIRRKMEFEKPLNKLEHFGKIDS